MRKASLLTIFLIVLIDLMGFGIVLPILQNYGQRFGISNAFFLTLIGTSYSLFQFLFAPILGRWSDRVGRRPVLIISQFGTLVGFLILFCSHFFEPAYVGDSHAHIGIALIFLSRVIDGISGGNISTAFAYVADITTPENRSKGMGLLGAAFGIGFVLGPVIGATVTTIPAMGLPAVPLVAAAFSFAALLMTIFYLPESLKPDNKRIRSGFPLLGLKHVLQNPVISPLILMFFTAGFAFAGMEQTFSLLIQRRLYPFPSNADQHQIDVLTNAATRGAGYLFGVVGIVIVIVQGGLIGKLVKKFGETKLVIAGPLIIALGLILVAAPIPWLWPWTGFLLGSACLALGNSLFNPSITGLISRHTPANEQGEILGVNQGMASLARATGPLLAGILFQYVFVAPFLPMGTAPYYASAVLCILVCLWAITIRHKLKPPAAAPATETIQPIPVE